jgi:hypothetical protein
MFCFSSTEILRPVSGSGSGETGRTWSAGRCSSCSTRWPARILSTRTSRSGATAMCWCRPGSGRPRSSGWPGTSNWASGSISTASRSVWRGGMRRRYRSSGTGPRWRTVVRGGGWSGRPSPGGAAAAQVRHRVATARLRRLDSHAGRRRPGARGLYPVASAVQMAGEERVAAATVTLWVKRCGRRTGRGCVGCPGPGRWRHRASIGGR